MILEDIEGFRKNLSIWFEEYQRRLPWRQTKDPYRIWVSEVMLQQTQVKKVLEYYYIFVDKFPDVYHLAKADLQDVLKVWERMGYYARARNLHKASAIIVEKMDGKIPEDYREFHNLPGVGDYIAAAVQSIAFNKPYAVVDGNIKRVIARLFLIDLPVNKTSTVKKIQEYSDLLLDKQQPGIFNQAMMELGALVCRPKNPDCISCPVSVFCEAYQAGLQSRYPIVEKSKPIPQYHISVGIVQRKNQFLITRRKPDGLLGGLWEFPGGKVEEGESADQACAREIKEETNISVKVVEHFTRIRHAYTHFKIVMDVFRCQYRSGKIILKDPVDYRWIKIDEIDQFPFPVANHKFIPLLKKETA